MVGKELLLSPNSNPIVQNGESLVLPQTATTNIQLDKKLKGRVDEVLLDLADYQMSFHHQLIHLPMPKLFSGRTGFDTNC